LVLATLETKLEIETQHILLIWVKVYFVCDVFYTEKFFSAAKLALETIGTFPAAVG